MGLPAALGFVQAGFDVTGVDVQTEVTDQVNRGQSPNPDASPGGEVAEAIGSGRFRATTETAAAVRDAGLVVVCVPTPVDEARRPDLGPLRAASRAIGQGLARGTVVCYESTTFPGCTERECIPILEVESGLKAGEDFGVAYCPERMNPGDAQHRTQTMSRVLGALDDHSFRVAHAAYTAALEAPIYRAPDLRTAEASKVFENVQRDVNLALVNEFARLCPRLGLDAHEVLAASGTKYNFVRLSPGPGVGGHCIPVDPHYLIEEARRVGFEPRMMLAAREANEMSTDEVVKTVRNLVQGAEATTVTVLGLSYKGGVGDLRESPSLQIVKELLDNGHTVQVHEPHVPAERTRRATGLDPARTVADAAKGADVIVLATDHPAYAAIDWQEVAAAARSGAAVADARNLADVQTVRQAGLRYWGLGRGSR